MRKQKRVFEVTGGQIWTILILGAFALTIVFEVGVSIGKKRAINIELEAGRKGVIQTRIANRITTAAEAPLNETPSRQPDKRLETGEKEAHYTIQVATFSSRQNAENLANSLKSDEYGSRLEFVASDAGKTYYCVFVGEFGTEDEADRFGTAMQERLPYIDDYRISKMK